jgi:hypothetical protein
MPSHLYGTTKPPADARWYDIILAHAVELSVALYSAFMGTLVVLRAESYEPGAGGILGHLPVFLVYGIGAFVGLGGLTALWGLLVRKDNIRAELNIEQVGWILIAAGWLSYLYAAIRYADGPSSAVAAGMFIGLGAVARAIALIVLERELERTMAAEGGETKTQEGTDDAEH